MCSSDLKKGPTFRHKEYKEYKGTRQSTPSELAQQFPMIREILEAMNIVTLELSEYEADDIAGTLARTGEEEGLDTILVTGDKDYLQLATDHTQVLITRKGISELDIYDKEKIVQEFGITPTQFIDLKGLMGDKSDNIPGVPGIGEKTGLKLLIEYGDMDNVYKNIDNISGKKLKENLIENQSLAYISKRLGEIITHVPLDVKISDLAVKESNWNELVPLYENYEFKSLLNKIPNEFLEKDEVINTVFEHRIIEKDFSKVKEAIKKDRKFAFKFITEDWNYMESNIINIGIKTNNSPSFILNLKNTGEEFKKAFKEIFEDEKIEKIGHSIKTDILILFRLGIQIKNYTFDSMIGQYLINPAQSNYSINHLSDNYLGYYGLDEEGLVGKGKNKKTYGDLTIDEVSKYLSFILETVFKLEPLIVEEILEQDMKELYYEVELPLVEVLSSMEFYGFKVDKEELVNLGIEYDKEIETLTKEIYELADMKFNIKSPKQIGEILFDKLGLPVIKKTKTGYSTDIEVLEKLLDQHPIIEKIIRYRSIVKLKSTYIDGLIVLINKDTNRIHSSFNQTIAITGRISSTEPNLQNIPIKTEEGKKIRKAFIAQAPEYKLLDGDYSQIELRVLAHISKDPKMKEAFINNEDIHTKTASEVFHLPIEDVTPTIRNNAKAVNFGIVYGISDYGLSRDLNIGRKEAKEYIDNYLDNYKLIKQFMVDIVEEGKANGYVETLLHRRRYVPELSAKNFNVRSFGERIAMNTPIQGSAADIIKVAMVRVYNELKNRNLKSRLILQVHDELLIETYIEEIEEVKTFMKEIMENSIKLDIPLKVDLKLGDNWYDTH